MKNCSMVSCVITLFMLTGIVISLSNVVLANDYGERFNRVCCMAHLTDEQCEAILAKAREMRSHDASREEILTTVGEMLQAYGIELPEKQSTPSDLFGFRPGPADFLSELTLEQREAIHAKVEEMRSSGSSREEIRASVDKMLEGYGIDVLKNRGGRFGSWIRSPFLVDLTEEQSEAINAKIEEMLDQNATWYEIGLEVKEMLKAYGIELPY